MPQPVHARVFFTQTTRHREPGTLCDRARRLDAPSRCRDTIRRESRQTCSRPLRTAHACRITQRAPPVSLRSRVGKPLPRNPDSRPASVVARAHVLHVVPSAEYSPPFPSSIPPWSEPRQCARHFPLPAAFLRHPRRVGGESEILFEAPSGAEAPNVFIRGLLRPYPCTGPIQM